ncbi:MAG: hypothetical protein H0W66_04915 [Chthoniobacterales bacterium]|nr:hypothetical protein [Chthoniobacterales bacterium]
MRKLLVLACLFVIACHKPEPSAPPPTPSAQERRAERAAAVPEAIQRHWTFLNQIRQDDAVSGSISRTLVNDQNQLGVVLYSSVTPDKVPDLMREVLRQMGAKFPGEDTTLGVYMTASPPRKIGVAHLEGKTAETSYTPL